MHIRVYGIPAAQGSKRAMPVYAGSGPDRHATGKVNLLEMGGQKLADWRQAIRDATARELAARGGAIPDGPVSVILQFYMPRPANHFGTGRNSGQVRPSAPGLPVGRRSDLDKLERAALDALTQGGAWRDDGQVALVMKGRYYASADCPPGCEIWISRAVLPSRMTLVDKAAELRAAREG